MDKRVQFDFEVDFTNGGGIHGRDFRLDIYGDEISDSDLANYIVRDMRLLMAGDVRILNKRIITEKHKRSPEKYVDLSHTIENGLVTYKGLPAPIVCDYLSREKSRETYAPGTEFQIGKIEMVANTGTYLDTPFHRYEHGKDLSQFGVERFAGLDGVVIRTDESVKAIEVGWFKDKDLRGRAVLVHTGWNRHWNTEQYFEDHPYLTEDAAEYLRDAGAALVGIDSKNIDESSGNARPVHSILLAAEILIVEHLCNLDKVPDEGFRFSAVPPKFRGVGTFPVRAIAELI